MGDHKQQNRSFFPALAQIMNDLKGKTVLDVGCGEGYGVRWAKQLGADAVGIDISQNNINDCKKKDPEGDYYLMDARSLSLEETYDYVMSILVLLNFDKKEDITQAISEMNARVQKDGKIIIATVHPAFDTVNENMDTMTRHPLDEYSYDKSGLGIEFRSKKEDVSFIDFHWRIEDYSDCIKEAGLVIEQIIEPLPIAQSQENNSELYTARKKYPPLLSLCVQTNDHISSSTGIPKSSKDFPK